MCCHLHISSDPPPLGRSDWSIVKPSIGKRPNSNNIFFSKGNSNRLKSVIQSLDLSQGSRIDEININSKHGIQSYATALKSSPNGDLTKPQCAASGKCTKDIMKDISKDHESKEASAATAKEMKATPVPVTSSAIDLPYLDDFDDSSSTEENNIEERKNDFDTDDDDECNLILTLANPRNSPSKKSKSIAETLTTRKPETCRVTGSFLQKKNRAVGPKVPEIPLSPVAPSSCSKKKKNAKQKNPVLDYISASPSIVLPPVNTAVDEVYYFSQYVQASVKFLFISS